MNTKTALFCTVAVIMMASAYATSCADHSDCSDSAPFCISQTCSPCHALRHPFDDTLCDTLTAGSRCLSSGACATAEAANTKRILDTDEEAEEDMMMEEDDMEEDDMEEDDMEEDDMEEDSDEEEDETSNEEEDEEEDDMEDDEEDSDDGEDDEEEDSDDEEEEEDINNNQSSSSSSSASFITISFASVAAIMAF